MKKSRLIFFLMFLILDSFMLQAQKSEPIQFKADKVEYIFKKGNEQTICRGNAKVWRSDFILKANLIKLYGKDNNISKAFRNVVIISPKDNTIITGDYAEYNNETGYAKVFKNPVLNVTNKKLQIKSGIMENYINENKSVAIGNVKIAETNFTAYCEKGIYYKDEDKIELRGNPVVYYGKDVFRSKKIVVYIKRKNVKLYGDVSASITSKKDRRDKKSGK